jgi:hypothetical protein
MGYYKDAEETRKEECKKYDCLNNNIEIFMNGYSFYSDGTPAS